MDPERTRHPRQVRAAVSLREHFRVTLCHRRVLFPSRLCTLHSTANNRAATTVTPNRPHRRN
eukprot:scaffold3747_cov240-Pinguiococcus_pyrenoidosus.AAC.4